MSIQDQVPPNGKAKVYGEDGQTCIPKEVREEVGFEKGDVLFFAAVDGGVLVEKAIESE